MPLTVVGRIARVLWRISLPEDHNRLTGASWRGLGYRGQLKYLTMAREMVEAYRELVQEALQEIEEEGS